MSEPWKCRSCGLPIEKRWKKWPAGGKQKVDLWEFLTKCPECGDQVMVFDERRLTNEQAEDPGQSGGFPVN